MAEPPAMAALILMPSSNNGLDQQRDAESASLTPGCAFLYERGQATLLLHPPSELGPGLGHTLVERRFLSSLAGVVVLALRSGGSGY